MGASTSVRSYARLVAEQEFASEVKENMDHAPLPVMPENRIRLTDRSELPLSGRIAVHIRVVLFTELTECLVNGNPHVKDVRWMYTR